MALTNKGQKISFIILLFSISLVTIFIELLYPKFQQFMELYGYETTIIPISMLGMGAGGLLAYFLKSRIEVIPLLSVFFSISIVFSIIILLFLHNYFLAIILFAIPFAFSTAVLAIAFARLSAFQVYSASLLGSGAGVLLLSLLLGPFGGENCLLFASGLACLGATGISAGLDRKALFSEICLILVLSGLIVSNYLSDSLNLIKLMPYSGRRFTNYVGSDVLKTKPSELIESSWSLIARVDIIREQDSIMKSLFGDTIKDFKNPDVRETFMALSGTGENLNLYYNNHVFTYLPHSDRVAWKMPPYTLLDSPRVLIIGVGGGVDIAIARYNNARRIVGVEINPATVRLMSKSYFNNENIYRHAEIHEIDGRSFVRTCREKFDLIQLMFTELYIPFPHSQVFVENYLYTVEAFQDYLRILDRDGIIFINKWLGNYDAPGELLRITTTAYEAMKREGIAEPGGNIIIVGYYISGWQTNGGYILLKKKPFKKEEINLVRSSLGEPMFLLYSPEDRELNNPFAAFIRSENKEDFYERSPLNISPTYDDRPYMNQFDKELREHWKLSFKLAFLSFVLLVILAVIMKRAKISSQRIIFSIFTVMLIATGYIWVELVLIQKFNILLGSPVLSMAVILTTLFALNGVGSFVASWVDKKMQVILLIALPVVLFFLYLFYPDIIAQLENQDKITKILGGVLLVMPIGFFSGLPFPLLVHSVTKDWGSDRIPLLIAFDSIFSVLAVGAIMLLSVIYGFNLVFLLSIFIYLIGIVMILFLQD